jgi:hypothetical protein
MTHKFVVSSVGRSGTAYTTKFLKNLGVKVEYEGFSSLTRMSLFDFSSGVDGVVSLYSMPCIKRLLQIGIRTIVQIRNPIQILNSMLAIDRWVMSPKGPGRPCYFHVTENTLANYIMPIESLNLLPKYIVAMGFILGWYRFAEGATELIIRVEDIQLDEGEPSPAINALLEAIEFDASPQQIINALPDDLHMNGSAPLDDITQPLASERVEFTWETLRAICEPDPSSKELMETFTQFGNTYGYETDSRLNSAIHPPNPMTS